MYKDLVCLSVLDNKQGRNVIFIATSPECVGNVVSLLCVTNHNEC